MLVKLLLLFTFILNLVFTNEVSDRDDIDPIIYYLLNGEYEGLVPSSEDQDEPILNGGIWKCGKCEDIGESKLIYSEMNTPDMTADPSVDMQIGVTLDDLKCITVRGSTPGIVTGVDGDCEGPSVTLRVLPTEHFVLSVYSK